MRTIRTSAFSLTSHDQTKRKINLMKGFNYILTGLLMMGMTINSMGQSRKYVSNFSHFQSYFNPSLTGYEGSTIRGFVRNQWSGIRGAPKTYFISAEIDFGEVAGNSDPALMGNNAVSVNLLQDTYGAFQETEFIFAYASRIRLTGRHNLRLGAGMSYQNIRLDGDALSTKDVNDPIIGQYLGGFSDMQVMDFSIGMALTHSNYYLSYGVHRVAGGTIMSGDEFKDGYPASNVIQGGYRDLLNPNVALIFNAFYRTQKDADDHFEMNVKALMMEQLWVGFGHRFGSATNLQMGVLANRMRVGYLFEIPMGNGSNVLGNTHEFSVVFNIFKDYRRKFLDSRRSFVGNRRLYENDILMW